MSVDLLHDTFVLTILCYDSFGGGARYPVEKGERDPSQNGRASRHLPICQPEGARVLGGFGPPRICDLPGGPRDFHDGGGLCSPGRWPPDRRNLADSDSWSWLRTKLFEKAARRAGSVDELEREVFRVAAGGEEGCRLGDQHFIKELVDTMGSWMEAQDLAVPGLVDIAEGQPLRLKLIRAILQAADDPDRDFLLQAEIGLPVGILEPLPRTPHVFELQEKWPLENTPWEPALAWVPNYGSTRNDLDFAKAKFDEEIEEGLMEKMSPKTFRERFGENTPTIENGLSFLSIASRSNCFFSRAPGALNLSRHFIRWLTRTPWVASWISRFLSFSSSSTITARAAIAASNISLRSRDSWPAS